MVLKGVLRDGLYKLDTIGPVTGSASSSVENGLKSAHCFQVNSVSVNTVQAPFVNVVVSKATWHRRLGHPSTKIFETIIKRCKLPVKANDSFNFCEACQFGKLHALAFPISNSRASAHFELIHTDLWGPAPVMSTDGYRYYVHFIDDYSRFTWIYPLKLKGDTFAAFSHFLALVKMQFGGTVKMVQSDNGTEYNRVHHLCSQMGIKSRFSCPYTSAQNGRAERKHRHIVETGLTLLEQASMPLHFWWDAFCHTFDKWASYNNIE